MVALPFCQIAIQAQKPKPDGYPEKLETVGEHLRARRLDLFLFQKDVAKILNVSTCTIENWELGRSFPMKGQLPKVIKFLGEDSTYVPIEIMLGLKLKKYRRKHSLTQKVLAKQVGIGLNT